MNFLAINQAYLFLLFSLNGVIIGLLYDVFRILRKTFKTNNFVTYIEDILFWILTGIIIIFFMYNFSDGSLRIFMIFGLIIGILIYIITFSKIIINFSMIVINGLKKIICVLLVPIKIFLKLLLKVINFLKLKVKLIMLKLKNYVVKIKNTKKQKK